MKGDIFLLKKLDFNSIRTKLIISLISICIIPLIILGFFLIINQNQY